MFWVRSSDLEYAQISAYHLHTHKPAWVLLFAGKAREMVLLLLTGEHYLYSNPLQSATVPCFLGPGKHFLFVGCHSRDRTRGEAFTGGNCHRHGIGGTVFCPSLPLTVE